MQSSVLPLAEQHHQPTCSPVRSQTILEQLKGIFGGREPLPPSKITPTVGLNIGRIQLQRVKLIVWDLGGQAALRSIWEK